MIDNALAEQDVTINTEIRLIRKSILMTITLSTLDNESSDCFLVIFMLNDGSQCQVLRSPERQKKHCANQYCSQTYRNKQHYQLVLPIYWCVILNEVKNPAHQRSPFKIRFVNIRQDCINNKVMPQLMFYAVGIKVKITNKKLEQMMKECLAIGIAIIFLMSGSVYGGEKIIDTQNIGTIQGIFLGKSETLREVVGGIAVFLVLVCVSAECCLRIFLFGIIPYKER
ncbi:MAG: hypothetical protein EZS28_049946, partial [Streblomastix strix]